MDERLQFKFQTILPGYVTDICACIKSNKKHKECGHPKSNPKPEGKIVPVLVLAHFVKDSLEHIDRASGSQENKWLSRKKAKKYPTNQA